MLEQSINFTQDKHMSTGPFRESFYSEASKELQNWLWLKIIYFDDWDQLCLPLDGRNLLRSAPNTCNVFQQINWKR